MTTFNVQLQNTSETDEYWDYEIVDAPAQLCEQLHKLGYIDHVPTVDEVNSLLVSGEAGDEPAETGEVSYEHVQIHSENSAWVDLSATKCVTWTLKNGDKVIGDFDCDGKALRNGGWNSEADDAYAAYLNQPDED